MTEPYELILTQGAVGGFPINRDSILVAPMMERHRERIQKERTRR
jgi:hypothetical protein